MRRSRRCMGGITLRTGWSARISTRALTILQRAICHGGTLLIWIRFSAGRTCLRMCARRARGPMKSGVRRGLRGLRGAAAAAAVLLPAPLLRRLRRQVRPPGRRRRVASHRASGVGRAAESLALATGTPALRGSRSRHRAGARSAGCPRQLRAAHATRTTMLAGPWAFLPRIRRLLESSQARERRPPTASGFASRRTRSIKRTVWLVLGGAVWVRSAALCPRMGATCSARSTSPSKGQKGGMGAWTVQSPRPS